MELRIDPRRPETFRFSKVAVSGWLKYVSNGNDFWWANESDAAQKGDVRWAHPLNAWAQTWIESGQISYA